MIVCQNDNNPHQFTVILEDEIVDDVHNRTEKQLLDQLVWNTSLGANNEQRLAGAILAGLLAGA